MQSFLAFSPVGNPGCTFGKILLLRREPEQVGKALCKSHWSKLSSTFIGSPKNSFHATLVSSLCPLQSMWVSWAVVCLYQSPCQRGFSVIPVLLSNAPTAISSLRSTTGWWSTSDSFCTGPVSTGDFQWRLSTWVKFCKNFSQTKSLMTYQGCFHFYWKTWTTPGPLDPQRQEKFILRIVGTLGKGLSEGSEVTNESYDPVSNISFIVQLSKVLNRLTLTSYKLQN